MGGCDFTTSKRAATAKEAYAAAVEDARYESGHGGYTGTIAEKSGFELVKLPAGVTPREALAWIPSPDEAPEMHRDWARKWNRQYEDKWGAACCVQTGEKDASGHELFVFFGVASS